MSESMRPRGVMVYPMPEEVGGPPVLGQYALLVRPPGQVRMVHTEGVAYLVTDEKPWTWNDYDPDCPRFTPGDLIRMVVRDDIIGVDLADWVRETGNARLEENFSRIHYWAEFGS